MTLLPCAGSERHEGADPWTRGTAKRLQTGHLSCTLGRVPRGVIWDRVTFGSARRRRVMHSRLRQLDRLDAGESRTDWRGRLGGACVLVVTTALVLAFGFTVFSRQWGVAMTAHGIARRSPLGHPPTVVPTGGTFAFQQHQPGIANKPVTYDPCRPVHVVVNNDLAPQGADGLLTEAIDRVAKATGLHLLMDGTTHRLPDRNAEGRSSGGAAGMTPILVAWTTPQQVPALQGRAVGLGGSMSVGDQPLGLRHYVTGTVSLDTPDLVRMLGLPHGRALVRAVMMHELGHVVGLAHVKDPGEIMYSSNVGLTSFGPGDRRGFAALGSGECFG
jgi:Matrixin